MKEYTPEEAIRNGMLRDAGLVVVDASYSIDGISPVDAWRVIANASVVPTVRISCESNSEEYLIEVDRSWNATAEEFGIFRSGGDFLISVADERIASLPWAHVRRCQDIFPARYLLGSPGEPEFVAASMDGRVICGATTEEYEIWVVGVNLA